MKISDLRQDQIYVGLRVRSLVDRDHLGTVVKIDPDDDWYSWIKWDKSDIATSGFYWTDCECEVVSDV